MEELLIFLNDSAVFLFGGFIGFIIGWVFRSMLKSGGCQDCKMAKQRIKFRQPKYEEGQLLWHTDSWNAPLVGIVAPIRYEETDYGWDWVYRVKYMNGVTGELYQIDLHKRKPK